MVPTCDLGPYILGVLGVIYLLTLARGENPGQPELEVGEHVGAQFCWGAEYLGY
jgi:hypothetical protein